MTPEEYCQQKAAPRGSALFYALLRAPAARRPALLALHAWWREVAGIADEVHDTDVARQKLAWWARESERCLAGQAAHPVTRALAPYAAGGALRREPFAEVIEALDFDLRNPRYVDYALLRRQAEQSVGAVSELSATLLGATDEGSRAYARQLGVALRLVAAIRNVGRDARHGCVRLPLEDLQRFGVTVAELRDRRYVEGFQPLMRFQAQRARATLAHALSALPADRRAALHPTVALAAIYRALLDEIEQAGFAVLHQRIALTPLRKLWIAWRAQQATALG
jgi:phytoene synthase